MVSVRVRKLSSEYTPGLGPRLYSEASRAQPYTKVVCHIYRRHVHGKTSMARETKCIIGPFSPQLLFLSFYMINK